MPKGKVTGAYDFYTAFYSRILSCLCILLLVYKDFGYEVVAQFTSTPGSNALILFLPTKIFFVCGVVALKILRSFSIDDADGSENVTFKMNLFFFNLCRVNSNLLKIASVDEFPWS